MASAGYGHETASARVLPPIRRVDAILHLLPVPKDPPSILRWEIAEEPQMEVTQELADLIQKTPRADQDHCTSPTRTR
jgi:hypothetical protein